MSINRAIHQIWLGSDMPKKLLDWCHRMRLMNPSWRYKIHSNELLDRYCTDPIVEWMLATNEKTAFLVDRLRVLLLRDEGGCYLDCDCFPVRPLDALDLWEKDHVGFVAGIRPPDRQHVSLHPPGIALVDNTVLASEPNGMMINRLCGMWSASARKQNGMSCGREILRNADQRTVLLSWKYFYSMQEYPETIVLHDGHNQFSWGSQNDSVLRKDFTGVK